MCRTDSPSPREVIGWLAWADDGRVYRSETDGFGDLPDDGVLLVKLFYADAIQDCSVAAPFGSPLLFACVGGMRR